MKNILLPITIGMCSLLFVSNRVAAQGAYNIAPLNALVDVLLPKKIHKKPDSITVFSLLKQDASYLDIETKCKTEWNGIIDNRALINGGDEGKQLVYWAMQELTANDYMSLLEKVTTLYESGDFEEKFMKIMIFPPERMRAFAADNFQHVRMISVINRIKVKTVDADFTANLNDVLSGNSKTLIDNFRAGHAGLARGNIPQVILPN